MDRCQAPTIRNPPAHSARRRNDIEYLFCSIVYEGSMQFGGVPVVRSVAGLVE